MKVIVPFVQLVNTVVKHLEVELNALEAFIVLPVNQLLFVTRVHQEHIVTQPD